MTALPGPGQNQGLSERGSAESAAAAPQPAAPAQTAQPAAARAPSRWLDETLWRRWALRLLSLWVLLALLMVGLRVNTASIRPGLRDAMTAKEDLVKQRDALSTEVQSLGSAGRIARWAEEAGMLRFADSLKRSTEIQGVPTPKAPAAPSEAPLRLKLQWGQGGGANTDAEPVPAAAPSATPQPSQPDQPARPEQPANTEQPSGTEQPAQ
ncbi:hypothetical protein [Deinococcus sp. Marseille-Q6407]|uniref:hypothetical protein n=1 Tax=Deinococcus sp. Marseille-Q6407 TaxID=2969223 RepID=UPI0021BF43AF|nr:hypothetical protein [Deinococcus sp. Marseille-Q6407]